jgi:23S rRNA (cytosine1962-C5)-methyltransferase
VVRLLPGKEAALRAGRPWVYRGEIDTVEGTPASGDVVVVADARGRRLAAAFYHQTSLLACRILSRDPEEVVDAAFFRRRIEAACALRRRLLPDVDACRLVFAEADGIPGLVADRFATVIVLQTTSAGTEAYLPVIADALADCTGLQDFFERNDGPVRRLEGLPERIGTYRGAPPEEVEVHEGPLRLAVHLRRGQKTGHFLDQRDNRVAFGRLVRRLLVDGRTPAAGAVRVLDAFCYTGGFGLHALAAGAGEAVLLDSAESAVAAALDNARRNGLSGAVGLVGNAFDELRGMVRAGERFDAVVLDPPAFARNRAQLDSAYRGYKELNLRALRLLRPGGLLCTCSCSQPVSETMFEEMLRDAAADAGRRVRVLERRGAGPDHPGLLGAAETRYLKCFFLQVVD